QRSSQSNRVQSELQFHPRVVRNYDQISRKGTDPTNYYWVVTTKAGVTHFFGGDETGFDSDYVIRGMNGNVGRWLIKKTVDANGNLVRYHYRSGNMYQMRDTNEKYIDRITYSGHLEQEGLYEVIFDTDLERDESLRVDVQSDCRLGFERINRERIRRVKVLFNNQEIRGWRFSYTTGAFDKTLLTSLITTDALGNNFYEHRFDYFDDIRDEQDYLPYLPFIDSDRLGPEIPLEDRFNLLIPFSTHHSPLGSSLNFSRSIGGAFTIGPPGSFISKSKTGGVNYTNTKGSGYGTTLLSDVNGDGKPDRVFRNQNGLFYCPNVSDTQDGNILFGFPVPIDGPDHFSAFRIKGNAKGLEL
ncbi:MAG: SpvB/TcaC N-terminal domain-containing protein, partial [Bacteroidota bacterium]